LFTKLEVPDDNVESVAKRKKHKAHSNTVRTSQFVQQVQGIIDKDPSKSIRAISRDAAAYIAVLKAIVKPWIDSVCGEKPYVFQQDSAPSHKATTTQDWMSKNLHDYIIPNMWPPSFPDFNPLDYYVWGVVEWETNKHPHNTLDSLRAITRVMTHKDKDPLIRASKRFRQRIEVVIAAEGDFIE